MESNKNNKTKSYLRKDLKSFLRSLAVLLLVVMVVFGTTFAWIEGGRKALTMGENCSVEAGAGLQFIGIDPGDIQNGILELPTNVTLEDCSSVDGRNFFLPTTGSIRSSKAVPDKSDLSNLVFRSGLDVDANSKYITKDFIVSSMESSSTPGSTPIYIGSGSTFRCQGEAADRAKAFRVSINFNDGTDPVVLCPALSYATEKRVYTPVSGINSSGAPDPTPATFSADPMAKYYYGQTPVYELPNGESRRVTITLWLEGTDDDCTSQLAASTINMNLILSTEDSHMRTITFVDYSPSSWVKNNNATMYVVERTSKAPYAMTRTGDITYTASVPDSFSDIYFQRTTTDILDPNAQNAYNSWSTGEGDDNLSTSTTYYAIGRGIGNNEYIDNDSLREKFSYDVANYGYWVDSSCTGIIEVVFNDTGGNFQSKAGGFPNIYMWNSMYYNNTTSEGYNFLGSAWPGCHMDSTDTTNQFKFYMPADSNLKFIISGNGNVKTDDLSISDLATKYFTSFDPNKNYKIVYNGVGGVKSFTQQ